MKAFFNKHVRTVAIVAGCLLLVSLGAVAGKMVPTKEEAEAGLAEAGME